MSHPDPRHDSAGYLYMALGFVGVATFMALAFVTARIGPAAIPIWGMAMGGAWMISRSPIGQAVAYRLGLPRPEEQHLVEVPQEVYGELDELRARIVELEERADFTERLLARQSDGQAAP